jgi:hypothetical protein
MAWSVAQSRLRDVGSTDTGAKGDTEMPFRIVKNQPESDDESKSIKPEAKAPSRYGKKADEAMAGENESMQPEGQAPARWGKKADASMADESPSMKPEAKSPARWGKNDKA